MVCPLCKEEALPDATICRFCSASLSVLAATGVTERLTPADVVLCPACQVPMSEGFLHHRPHTDHLWWVAGKPEREY